MPSQRCHSLSVAASGNLIWRSTERSVEAVKEPEAHHLSFSYHPGNDDALYFDI
jgi:hypothetical protein